MNSLANRCILGPVGDAVFFVAMPGIILATFAAAASAGLAELLAAGVMSSLSLGHHFPGFLRIYADPELFRRYRLRFVVLPLLLIIGALLLAAFELHGLLLILFFWGVWHGLMQVYGFARIYDAKVGDFSRLSAWLDWLMCASWFSSLTLSSFRQVNLRHYCDQVGLGFLAEILLARPVVDALAAVTAVCTGVYIGHLGWRWFNGKPVNPWKVGMMATTFTLLFLAYRNFAKTPLISLALFEAYHDIQYFAIVWSFGKRQSDRRLLRSVGNWLFRPRMVLFYIALILLYGSLDSPFKYLSEGQLLRQVTVLVAVSTLLHFYFDGFIWKLRKRTIEVDSPSVASSDRTPESAPAVFAEAGWSDLARQAALIAIPIAALLAAQLGRSAFELPAMTAVARVTPATAESCFALARLQARYGREEDAIETYKRAVDLNPESRDAWYNLGVLLERKNRPIEAEQAFRRTIAADASFPYGHLQLVNLLRQSGREEDAVRSLESAVADNPDSPVLLMALASLLMSKPNPEMEVKTRAVSLAEQAAARSRGSARWEALAELSTMYRAAGRQIDAQRLAIEALDGARAAGPERTRSVRQILNLP